ncbi:MAG TPA: DUF4404 family protein [Thermoanaerobaculia bacterium]|jgi:hypothetical protein|nr:DUF4404 family protein [Thermoanaerobaculia bacterium]
MVPDRRELHRTLERLHDELHDAERVGESDRALLEELMADIQRVLDEPAEEAAAAGHQGLKDRLTESVYELEESHPQLVASVRNVVNYLSAMGI